MRTLEQNQLQTRTYPTGLEAKDQSPNQIRISTTVAPLDLEEPMACLATRMVALSWD